VLDLKQRDEVSEQLSEACRMSQPTFPFSTSASRARQVGKWSSVNAQSMLGFPSSFLPFAKATGQLRNCRKTISEGSAVVRSISRRRSYMPGHRREETVWVVMRGGKVRHRTHCMRYKSR
jgi:hypothetical protein